jgi:Transcriptional regulators
MSCNNDTDGRKKLIADLIEKIDILCRSVSSYKESPMTYGAGPDKITLIEMRMVYVVGRHPGISNRELASYLQRTKSTVSVMTDSMSEKGYICKKQSDTDSRKCILTLSEKGEELFRYRSSIIENYFSDLAEELEKYDDCEISRSIEILDDLLLTCRRSSKG